MGRAFVEVCVNGHNPLIMVVSWQRWRTPTPHHLEVLSLAAISSALMPCLCAILPMVVALSSIPGAQKGLLYFVWLCS